MTSSVGITEKSLKGTAGDEKVEFEFRDNSFHMKKPFMGKLLTTEETQSLEGVTELQELKGEFYVIKSLDLGFVLIKKSTAKPQLFINSDDMSVT